MPQDPSMAASARTSSSYSLTYHLRGSFRNHDGLTKEKGALCVAGTWTSLLALPHAWPLRTPLQLKIRSTFWPGMHTVAVLPRCSFTCSCVTLNAVGFQADRHTPSWRHCSSLSSGVGGSPAKNTSIGALQSFDGLC